MLDTKEKGSQQRWRKISCMKFLWTNSILEVLIVLVGLQTLEVSLVSMGMELALVGLCLRIMLTVRVRGPIGGERAEHSEGEDLSNISSHKEKVFTL